MRDPYEVLGVGRDASAGARSAPPIASSPRPRIPICTRATRRPKSASRRSPPPTNSCQRRGQAQAVRPRRDRRQRRAEDAPVVLPRLRARARAGPSTAGSGSFENAADLEDMIQELFGGRGGGRTMRMRAVRRRLRLEIGLGDVARGAKIPITLADGRQRRGDHPAPAWRPARCCG